jgi:hypothetical protein
MKTELTIYLTDGTTRAGTCELAEHPTYDAINAVVRPLLKTMLTKHDHIEHVYVLGHDGERADMFVDDEGQMKDLPRNEAATAIYRRAWLAHQPDTAPDSLPCIYGDAVLFGRRIWF